MTLGLQRIKTIYFALTLMLIMLIATPVYGAGGATPIEDPVADATNRIASTPTEYRWFYWPGWAFAGLTLLIFAVMGFVYYKNILGPKYKGKKA